MMENVTVQETSRMRWVMAAVAFASFICSIDTYIVYISLPEIARAFNADTGEVSLVVIAYLLVMTTTIPLSGKLSETHGSIRILVAGYAVFTTGLLLCGISGSMEMLIASRCVEGIGASILITIPAALVLRYLSADFRGMAFRLMATAAAVGLSVGAPVGGIISAYLNWQWIFLVQIPPCLLALWGVIRLFPQRRIELTPPRSFDITGFTISFLGLATLLYIINIGDEAGWRSPFIVILVLLFIMFFLAFLYWERRHSEPILVPELFTNRNFAIASLASLLSYMAVAGNAFLLPFFLVYCKGLKLDKAGFVIMLFSTAMMVVAPLGVKVFPRTSRRVLCSAAMVSSIAAWLYFSGSLYLEGLMSVVIFLLWAGASIGLFISPNSLLFINAVPSERMGAVYVVSRSLISLGSLLGVSLFETIFSQAFSGMVKSDGIHAVLPQIPVDLFFSGFFVSYLFGAFLLLCALVCSILLKEEEHDAGFEPPI
ncbi:MAG: MFS transporter [Vulcanimicrobiota bacterium]